MDVSHTNHYKLFPSQAYARNGKIGLSIAIVCEVLAIPLRD